ncbi:MAG TPA: type II secretion system protein [Candidatus Paceibacterota bacterium]|jgi:prepilin-type N-terminal cleavage/methylation domain
MKNTKGFTLIELLVVIAIIGILSSVVLASLNTARAKGGDAAIKSQLAAIRPQAEIIYDNLGNYGVSASACSTSNSLFATSTVSNMIASLQNASGNSATCNTAGSPATSWAVSIPLKTSGAGNWCVDSTGASKSGTATSGACS